MSKKINVGEVTVLVLCTSFQVPSFVKIARLVSELLWSIFVSNQFVKIT